MMFLCIAIWLVAALLIPLLRLEPGLRATHPIVQAVAALIPSVVVAPCALAIAVL